MTVALALDLAAEWLTTWGHRPWMQQLMLGTAPGRATALCIPDGTVQQALFGTAIPCLAALVLTSDQALQVTLGTPTGNQPLALDAQGVLVLAGTHLQSPTAVQVTYAPGTGVPAQLWVIALGTQEAVQWTASFDFSLADIPLCPVWTGAFEE